MTKQDLTTLTPNTRFKTLLSQPDINNLRFAKQVHGTKVLNDTSRITPDSEADAFYTEQLHTTLLIRTADCVPVFFAAPHAIALAHAGWRGAKQGIVSATLKHFAKPAEVCILIGPSISVRHFEVGPDVYLDWQQSRPEWLAGNLHPSPNGGDRRMLDLKSYISAECQAGGVPKQQIHISPRCTYADPELPSYRRDKTQQRPF